MLSLLARLDEERGRPKQAVRRLRQYIAVMDQRVMQSVAGGRTAAEILGQAVGGGPVAQWQSEFKQLLYDLYDAHGRLGQLLATLGDLESAAAHFETRREAMEGLNDRLGHASALFQLARVAQAAGRAPAALDYLDRCIALIDQDGVPAPGLLLDALYDSAKLLFGQEQFEPAAERLERALTLARAHAPEQVIGIVRNLGVTEIKLLQPASAAQRFDEAVALASADGLPTEELQEFAEEARVLARLLRKLEGAGAGDEAH
jgi:tetratricopeptide (TPR) repeat protein